MCCPAVFDANIVANSFGRKQWEKYVMSRLTKGQRALRDVMRPGERSFVEALHRVTNAAEKYCTQMRELAAATTIMAQVQKHGRRAAFIQWAHDCGLSIGIATIAIRDESDSETSNHA